jgi:hypothetical protein
MKELLNGRIFWNAAGWFVTLRNCDKNLISFVRGRRLKVRDCGYGIIAGPFDSADQLETWFSSYLSNQSRPREFVFNISNAENDVDELQFITFSEEANGALPEQKSSQINWYS